MKTLFLYTITLLVSAISMAQTGINYKAIIKDGNGNVLANQTIDVQFIIYEGVALTNNVYQESHTLTTDAKGILIANIGVGAQQGAVFTDVDWSEADHFLNVQINAGAGFVDLGTTQFMAVPYAKVAENVTGLEAIDEGNGIGWRLITRNENNYDPIGFNAIDFSFVDNPNLGLGAIGSYAFSLGHNGTASGEHAFSFGNQNYSLNDYAIAIGNNNIVSGLNSTAIGAINQVSGDYSFAVGLQNEASENYSIAMGTSTTASGEYAIAMGQNTTASGLNATAFGRNTEATGISSLAMGRGAEASGNFSLAFGDESEAQGNNSIAMGDDSFATSDYAVAIGRDAFASGESSFAVGYNTRATRDYATSMGYLSEASGNASTAMGNNTEASGANSATMGSNTVASGSSAIAMGQETIASSFYSTAMGYQSNASGSTSTAMGYQSDASGNTSTAMGFGTEASGDYSTSMGYSTAASGRRSLASGDRTTASGDDSVAFGEETIASGENSLALGYNTVASDNSATALGLYTTASGYASLSLGRYTIASSTYAIAGGFSTTASGFSATSLGFSTRANSYVSAAFGRYNVGGGDSATWVESDYLFEIGNGTSGSRRNAFTVLKNGNIGVGTAAPQERLHITGGRLRIGTETIEDTGTNRLSFNADLLPDTDNSFRLGNSATRWTSVWAADGSINTSDRREKENITNLNYGLHEIMNLKPVSFNWKKRPETGVKLGLIAQDLQKIIPEVVMSEEVVYSEEDPTSFQKKPLDRLGVYYSDLIPVLIKAIQELKQENDELRSDVKSLLKDVNNFKNN